MSDDLMTPPEVYRAVEAVWGRPALDPCWHWASPVRPLVAAMLPQNFKGHKGVRRRTQPLLVQDSPDWTGEGVSRGTWADNWPLAMVRGYVWGDHGAQPVNRPGWAWLNPPYSDPGPWLRAAASATFPVVALVKADPSTQWWRDWVWHHRVTRVGFFTTRLRYPRTDGGKQYAANFPSAMVIYNIKGRGEPQLPIHWVQPVRPVW